MTTEKSQEQPAQKSFDVSKYTISSTDRDVVDVKVGEDTFKVEIKPLTWFRKNQLITQSMTFSANGETKFEASKYIKEVLKEIITDAPWGKTDDMFLAKVNLTLGQALEQIVPSATDADIVEQSENLA